MNIIIQVSQHSFNKSVKPNASAFNVPKVNNKVTLYLIILAFVCLDK